MSRIAEIIAITLTALSVVMAIVWFMAIGFAQLQPVLMRIDRQTFEQSDQRVSAQVDAIWTLLDERAELTVDIARLSDNPSQVRALSAQRDILDRRICAEVRTLPADAIPAEAHYIPCPY